MVSAPRNRQIEISGANRQLYLSPLMVTILFMNDWCKLLRQFMDLDVPGVPDCDDCGNSYPQTRVSICANCRFSGHLFNSCVHEEKGRFFRFILAGFRQELQIETNMRARFFYRLMISMISNCIELERKLVNIENRRHDLLVELSNLMPEDIQLISNTSRVIDEDEVAIFSEHRRRNSFRFARFRRYAMPFTSVHKARARRRIITIIRAYYPETVV